MCRWLAYSGGPIALSELIFDTEHSIIDQSLASHSSVQTTNGDGFGVGRFDEVAAPGLYKNRNLCFTWHFISACKAILMRACPEWSDL